VFLQALSDNSRASEPCRIERQYADDLGMPVLPVQVGPITSLRTWNVSEHQVIDYRTHEPRQVIRTVAAAVRMTADWRPPPTPAPPEPDAPFGYLRGLRELLDREDLNRREQHDIFFQIRDRLDVEVDGSARSDLVQLLKELNDRPDATRIVMSDVAELLEKHEASPPEGRRSPPNAPR
jgi:hypothetical protein